MALAGGDATKIKSVAKLGLYTAFAILALKKNEGSLMENYREQQKIK